VKKLLAAEHAENAGEKIGSRAKGKNEDSILGAKFCLPWILFLI
jgi:hypothetical protein